MSVLITLMPFQFIPFFFSYLIMTSNEFSEISATCFGKLITSCCGSTSATTSAQLPNSVDGFWMTKGEFGLSDNKTFIEGFFFFFINHF